MLVEMTLQIQGARDGLVWPPPGACIDVPDHEGEDLLAAGYAKEADKKAEAWDAEAATRGPDPAADSDDGTTEASDSDAGDDGGTVKGTAATKRTRGK